MRHIPRGHQANLCSSKHSGKTWDLWIDPDYSWHENAGEFVIESVTATHVVLKYRSDWSLKTVALSDIGKVIEHSYDRR